MCHNAYKRAVSILQTRHDPYEALSFSKHEFWSGLFGAHQICDPGSLLPYNSNGANFCEVMLVLRPFLELYCGLTGAWRRTCESPDCEGDRITQTKYSVLIECRVMAASEYEETVSLSDVVKKAVGSITPSYDIEHQWQGDGARTCGTCGVNLIGPGKNADALCGAFEVVGTGSQLFVQLPTTRGGSRRVCPLIDTELCLPNVPPLYLDTLVMWPNRNHFTCYKYIHGSPGLKSGWYFYDGVAQHKRANDETTRVANALWLGPNRLGRKPIYVEELLGVSYTTRHVPPLVAPVQSESLDNHKLPLVCAASTKAGAVIVV
jgi:hypothetical protein